MAKDFKRDIIGYQEQHDFPVAAVAADAADGAAADVMEGWHAYEKCKVLAAYWVPVTDQTQHADNYRTLKLVNAGAANAGTTVVASLALSTAATTIADNTRQALTLSTTAASLVLAAGDFIQYQTVKTGNGIALKAARIFIVVRPIA